MKKYSRLLLAGSALGLGAFSLTAHSQVMLIAEWNFNSFAGISESNGFGETLLADNGVGSMFVQSATTTGTNFNREGTGGTTLGAWDGTPAGGRVLLRRGERWNNGYIDLSFSMANRTELNFSFAGNIFNTFPTTTTLQWSNDGGANFTSFATLTHADDSPTNTFSLFVFESSDPNFDFSALDNQSDVVIRFQFSGGGGPGSSGAGFALDNIVVSAIPEPSTYAALFGLMGVGLVLWRRRLR